MSSKHLLAGVLACAFVVAGCDDPRLYPPKTAATGATEAEAAPAALTFARGAKPRAAAGTAAKGKSTMLDLLPEGTVGIVAVPKVKDFEQAFERLSALASPRQRSKPMNLPTLVRSLGVDLADFDLNRGACFAMTFPPGSNRPLMTAILPVRDEKTIAGKLKSIHPKSSVETSDGFAILTEKGTYKRGGTPACFDTPLPDGDLVVRFDAAAIWKKFGPVVTSELEHDLGALNLSAGSTPETAALMKRITAGIKSVAETASVYDLALRVDGSQFEVDAAVRFADGAKVPMADCFSKADLATLSRALPTQGMISMAMAVDAAKTWAALEPLAMASLESAPESTRAVLGHTFESIRKGMKAFGSGMAVTGGIQDGRIEVTGVMETRDPAAYVASMLAILSDLPTDGSPVTITPPEERTVDGAKVTTVRLAVDPDKLPAAGAGPTRAARSREAVESLFGKDGLAYNFVAMENRLLFVMGGDELLERVIRASRAGADAPVTPLSKALAAAGSDTVAYVNFDVGAFMREATAIAARAGAKPGRKPVLPPVESNPVSFILNASSKELRARVSMDIEKTAKLAAMSLPR